MTAVENFQILFIGKLFSLSSTHSWMLSKVLIIPFSSQEKQFRGRKSFYFIFYLQRSKLRNQKKILLSTLNRLNSSGEETQTLFIRSTSTVRTSSRWRKFQWKFSTIPKCQRGEFTTSTQLKCCLMFRLPAAAESELFYLANSFLFAFIFNEDCKSRRKTVNIQHRAPKESTSERTTFLSVLFLGKLLQLLEIDFIHVFYDLKFPSCDFCVCEHTLDISKVHPIKRKQKSVQQEQRKMRVLIHQRENISKTLEWEAENVYSELNEGYLLRIGETGWMSGEHSHHSWHCIIFQDLMKR